MRRQGPDVAQQRRLWKPLAAVALLFVAAWPMSTASRQSPPVEPSGDDLIERITSAQHRLVADAVLGHLEDR